MIWVRRFKLRNFLIFRDVELEFQPGLNVLAGESGSGKSLVLKALAGLAGKIPGDYLGPWGDEGELIAEVQISDGMVTDNILAVRKKIGRGKRADQAFASHEFNFADHIVYEKQLGAMKLINPKEQLKILDTYGNVNLARLNELLSKKDFLQLERSKLESELSRFRLLQENVLKRNDLIEVCRDFLRYGYDDIDEIFLVAKKAPDPSFLSQLDEVWSEFKRLIGAFKEESAEDLKEAVARIDDFIFSVIRRSNQFEHLSALASDQELMARLKFLIQDLRRNLGSDVKRLSEVIEYAESLGERTFRISSELERIEYELKELEKQIQLESECISETRRKAWSNMASQLDGILRSLDFSWFHLEGKFQPKEIDEHGGDQFEILVTFNKGVPLKPLRLVASGGEFNRFLFALAYISSLRENIPDKQQLIQESKIFLFDEIDSGLSGSALASLIKLLKEISQTHQVIVVSHNEALLNRADRVITLKKLHLENRTEVVAQIRDQAMAV